MKTVNDLKPGDIVWWIDVNNKGHIFDGEVSSVGSKLITVGKGWQKLVFRKDSLRTNDNYGHQSLIPDLDFYKEQLEASKIVWKIRDQLTYGQTSIPLENVKAAAKLLGINIEDAK